MALILFLLLYILYPLASQLHTDADRGEGRAKYLLTGEGAGSVFVIDDKTGNIHVTKSLDREEKEEYVLLAQAVDKLTLRPLEPPSQFIIKVQDINDNPPVFLHPPYRASVPEMSNVGEGGTEVFVFKHKLALKFTEVQGCFFSTCRSDSDKCIAILLC